MNTIPLVSEHEHTISALTETVSQQQHTIDLLVDENKKLKDMLATLSRQQSIPYPVSAKAFQVLHGSTPTAESFDTYMSNISIDSYVTATDTAGNVDIFEQAGIKFNGHSRMWVPPAEDLKKKKKKRRNSINKLCGKVREVLCFATTANKT
jgi:uncharacterized coiled-coil protein SlyX